MKLLRSDLEHLRRWHRTRAGAVLLACIGMWPRPGAGTTIDVPGTRPTIQAGIDAAVNGDTVRVADGTYTGAANRNIRFGGRSIVVRSVNGSGACTVDAQNAGRGFVFDAAEPSSARLEGFTITHGLHASAGGGVYISNSSPTLLRCVVVDNRTADGAPGTLGVAGGAGGAGAGVYVTGGAPQLVDCVISLNHTGDGGDGFVNQSGPGGSAAGAGGAGAGLYAGNLASVTLTRCLLADNVTGAGGLGGSSVVCVPPFACQTFGENGGNGGDGGGLFVAATVIAQNCLFAGNSTGQGGAAGFGLDLPLPSPGRGGNGGAWNGGMAGSQVTSCTLQGNLAAAAGGAGQPAGTGGGIEGTPTVVNSILWGNNSSQVPVAATVTYSIVQGGHSGTGNLASDPLFVNASSGNLRVQVGSPAIDAGSNAAVPPGLTTDLDGHDRILDGNADSVATVDMGAYEFLDTTDVAFEHSGASPALWVAFEPGDGTPIRIRYRLGVAAPDLRLDIYAVTGRLVRTLERGWRPAGQHSVLWDRRAAGGATAARGVYLVVLRDGGARATAKLTLLAR